MNDFVAALRRDAALSVSVLRMPVDVESGKTLRSGGESRGRGGGRRASALRVSYPLGSVATIMTKDDFKHIRWSLLAGIAHGRLGSRRQLLLTHRVALGARARRPSRPRQDSTRRATGWRGRATRRPRSRARSAASTTCSPPASIGTGKRLEWVEQIKRHRAARRLYDLQYEIAPQRLLDAVDRAGHQRQLRVPVQHHAPADATCCTKWI
ncbi:MAG: hypothetical protein MZW92_18260 [Comamonadaceae bacterium]|nr:hypothetical protein [Comamonadaceae bacterium]